MKASVHPRTRDSFGRKFPPLGAGACSACHLAHQYPRARAPTAGDPAQLCIHCHADKDYIKYTGHAAERLVTFESDIDSCKPCHAMHADPVNQWGQMLSPRFLNERCAQVGAAGVNCVPCLACHHESGPAPVREVWSHPEMIMMNIVPPGEPGYLPLFNADGREDANGQVVCRTCHVSHGRIDLLQRLAANPQMTPEEQHALRMQVRPFQVPNVCTACHGNEARDKFLHFHDLRWRKSPSELAGVPAAGATSSGEK